MYWDGSYCLSHINWRTIIVKIFLLVGLMGGNGSIIGERYSLLYILIFLRHPVDLSPKYCCKYSLSNSQMSDQCLVCNYYKTLFVILNCHLVNLSFSCFRVVVCYVE